MTAYLYYNGFLVRNESSSGSVATVQMMNGTVDMAVLVLQEATGVLKRRRRRQSSDGGTRQARTG